MGPAVSQAQLETDLEYIEVGTKEVGKPRFGGDRLTGKGPHGEDLSKGFFIAPTVFSDVSEERRIAKEEIFGPVAAIMPAKNFEHAMEMANRSPLGLSASVQTTNVARVFEFVKQMEAGLLTVNLPSAGIEYQLPFGGTKDSSFGPKEQGPAAAEFYTDFKTVYLKY
jgi:aldehyde dehydrogenase (NAD+)